MSSTLPRGAEPLVEGTPEGHTRYVLPLPGTRQSRALSPNGSHGSYHATARARRALKDAALTRIRQVRMAPATSVLVTLHYAPRTAGRRDADNLVPMLKPCIDALVKAGIVPDDTPDYVTWHAPVIEAPDAQRPRFWLEVTTR